MPSTLHQPDGRGRTRARSARSAANDQRILDAAKSVVGADPRASMADIARAAGVGMSALYLRYENKDALFVALLDEASVVYRREIARANARIDAGADAAEAFGEMLHAVVAADVHAVGFAAPGVARLRQEHAGSWDPVVEENQALLDRVAAAGGLRPGVSLSDIGMLMRAVAALRGAGPERSRSLRRRYLTVMLDGLRPELPELPGEPAASADYRTP